MSHFPPRQFFFQLASSGIWTFVTVVVLTCLLAVGCKSTDKSKSGFPFFGGGTTVNPPESEFPPEMPPISPAGQFIVNESPGPATPTSLGSPVTSGASTAYEPPAMLPTGSGLPSSTYSSSPASSMRSPSSSYSQDNMAMVYSPSPGANTNSGGVAGSVPSTYSGSGNGGGGTPTSRYGYGSQETTDSGYPSGGSSDYSGSSDYGRSYSPGGTSSPSSDTRYDRGSSNRGGSDYGGSSTPDNYYNYGTSDGRTTSLTPIGSPLEDGDYLAADGTITRVINGKKYELVQYFLPNPPILPGSTGDIQPQLPQAATYAPITSDYRTATQMTSDFGKVLPIPSYDTLLNQQENSSPVALQGIVTVTDQAKTIIIPDNAAIETVPSMNYSDYSEIGALGTTSSLPDGNNVDTDDEMQRSIWSLMARQNNDLLLYGTKNQSELTQNNLPLYFPLNNSFNGSVNQSPGNTVAPGLGSPCWRNGLGFF